MDNVSSIVDVFEVTASCSCLHEPIKHLKTCMPASMTTRDVFTSHFAEYPITPKEWPIEILTFHSFAAGKEESSGFRGGRVQQHWERWQAVGVSLKQRPT